ARRVRVDRAGLADQDAGRRRLQHLQLPVRRLLRHEHGPAGRVELVPVRPDRRRGAHQGPADHHRQDRQRPAGEEGEGHVPSPTTGVARTAGGRPRPAARQRRMARFDRLSFMTVFLGLPLAIYLIFVIYPFGQALYYSMTDWSGFSTTYNFVGLGNFTKLFHDDIFRRAFLNNVELAIVVPLVTIVLALAIAMVVTVGGPT